MRSTFISRISRQEVWGLPLLILTGWLYASLSFLIDVVALDSWSPAWILIYFVTFGEVVLLAWLYKRLVLKPFNLASGLLNLAVAGLLGVIKNVTVAPLAIYFGLLTEPLWAFRLFGGFTLGAGIFLFAGLALGARTEHTALMTQLTQVQATLLSLRNSSKARLFEANANLANQARDLLIPKLDQLVALVRDSGASAQAAGSLRELIKNDVRPLSQELSTVAAGLAEAPIHFAEVPKRYKLFRPRVELRGLIRPNAAALSAGFGALLLAYAILGAPRCDPVVYLTPASWAIAWIVKLVLPRGFQVSRRAATWLLFGLGTAMFLPFYLILLPEVETASETWLLLVIWPSTLASLMLFAFSESLDRDRVAVRAVIEAENKALAQDQALFEQQLWLGRRAWQLVIHGTVQSALTAALTRLQAEPNPEPWVLSRVVDDLERARLALTSNPERVIDFPDALNQLQTTWRGICQIKTNITDRASRALKSNNAACLCVNEILKEAVSNAIRHGEARIVTIEIDREDDFTLEIKVSNDGIPLRAQQPLGVGSRLIEELTTDWSLASIKATGLTVLKAKLPLQRV